MIIPGFGGKIKDFQELLWGYEKELSVGLLIVLTGVCSFGLGRYSLLPEKPPIRILQAATSSISTNAASVSASVPSLSKTEQGSHETAAKAIPTGLYFVGTRTTKKFRRSDCPGISSIAEKNRVIFKTKEDALAAGYVPVKNCPNM